MYNMHTIYVYYQTIYENNLEQLLLFFATFSRWKLENFSCGRPAKTNDPVSEMMLILTRNANQHKENVILSRFKCYKFQVC